VEARLAHFRPEWKGLGTGPLHQPLGRANLKGVKVHRPLCTYYPTYFNLSSMREGDRCGGENQVSQFQWAIDLYRLSTGLTRSVSYF